MIKIEGFCTIHEDFDQIYLNTIQAQKLKMGLVKPRSDIASKIYQDHYLFELNTTFFCFFLDLFYLDMYEKVQRFALKLPYWYKGVGAGATIKDLE